MNNINSNLKAECMSVDQLLNILRLDIVFQDV